MGVGSGNSDRLYFLKLQNHCGQWLQPWNLETHSLEEVKVACSVMSDISVVICNSNSINYTFHGILQVSILEWVDFLFFRGSSQPRDQTQVYRIAGSYFTSWVTREALLGRKAMTKVDSIFSVFKSRDITADKGMYSQSFIFSNSHVKMWVGP